MKKICTLLILSLLCVFCAIGFTACDNDPTNNTIQHTNNTPSSENNNPSTTYYTVTFNSDGGTEIAPIQVEEGKKCNAPDDPYKIGYAFEGWFAGNEQWSFIGYTITENINLTAHWSIDENNLGIFDWEKTNNEYTITNVKDKTLTEITIPDYITNIANNTFENCANLQSIHIGQGIKNIGSNAFKDCNNLENILYCGTASQWAQIDGLVNIMIKNSVWFRKLKIIKNNEIEALNDIVLENLTEIKPYAFCYCTTITSVTIGNNVTTIGNRAFYGCSNLTNITIPDSVASIGSGAFCGCSSLTNVTLPDSIISIGDIAFNWCYNLISITIPNSVISIGQGAFSSCHSLTSVNVPNNVMNIWSNTFQNCTSLTNITVSEDNENYKSIDGNLYSKDGTTLIQYAIGKTATEFIIPNSVTRIGAMAFYGCPALTSVTIPNGVTSIGDSAFHFCSSLTSVTIPDTVTSISGYAFNSCPLLTNITIPDNVRYIGRNAFFACNSLTSVTFKNTNGWQISDVVTFSSSILTNTQTAATYLKSTFNNYDWQRV